MKFRSFFLWLPLTNFRSSRTQPAESKEKINLDCTNILPEVATDDAFIKGASNESNSEGDDADTGLA